MSDASKIAVIGLGSMGYGMAQSLLRAGHETFGADINPDAVARFRAEGGAEGDLAEVAGALNAVAVVVLNAAQTETVLFGAAGLVPRMQAGAVVVACATVPPDFAKAMEARCAAHGVHYLDAPISGGSVKAAQGALSVMASGRPEAFAAAAPVLGVTPEKFVDVLSKCAGTSWMLENRAPHIVEGDYTPRSSVNIWPKDLGIVLDIARSAGFSAPITAAALQQYLAAAGQGLGQEDDAAVAKVYARNAGLTLPGQA